MGRRKKRSPWGTIDSKSRDKHVIRWVENTPDGRKRRCMTFHGTYREAALELARIRVEKAGDKPVPTIGQAYEMWYLPWMEERVSSGATKAGTARLYESCWKVHVAPRWERSPMDSVKPAEIQSWLSSLTAPIAKIAVVVLRGIGDFAVRYEVVPSNKFRIAYNMPTRKTREKNPGTYNLEQAESMLSAIRGTEVEAPFILACFGSCRTGESLGVRCSEVKVVESCGLSLAVVPIVRRMDQSGSLPLEDGDLKNPQSVRHVVIPEPYGTRLREIADSLAADGREWLADRGDGLPMNVGMLNFEWKKTAGEPCVPFSNLRTSWRTFAQYEWGADYDTLEVLMGHSLPGVTGKHYLKPTVENLTESLASAVAKSRQVRQS